jgi:bifunctional non-homologous end joining protein LigD
VTHAGSRGRPAGLKPMLATAGRLPAGDAGWAYEMKWDGLRAICTLEGGRVRLESRSGRDITHAYPELQPMATVLDLSDADSAVLDGEIVAFGGEAWPSFEALQGRMNISSAAEARTLMAATPVSYLIFDLLRLGPEVLLDRPYAERRARLEELDLNGPNWQTPPSFRDEAGADVLAVSRQQGLEGVVAKRLVSRYEPGRRSPSWIKVKNIYRQETVVGGWQPGEGGRSGQIGSLLIGVYEPAGLVYAGHVGTGFTRQSLSLLAERLAPLQRGTSPFASEIPAEHARYAQWVEPRLVIEVAFTQWTSAGRLRAPSYKGLRDDKDPAEVVREETP